MVFWLREVHILLLQPCYLGQLVSTFLLYNIRITYSHHLPLIPKKYILEDHFLWPLLWRVPWLTMPHSWSTLDRAKRDLISHWIHSIFLGIKSNTSSLSQVEFIFPQCTTIVVNVLYILSLRTFNSLTPIDIRSSYHGSPISCFYSIMYPNPPCPHSMANHALER